MKKFATLCLSTLLLCATMLTGGCSPKKANAPAAPAPVARPKMKMVVSVYAGWMPWYYANETKIIKKWADNYGFDVEVQYMSYPNSLKAFNTGDADVCVMTNMECLDMPAAAGIDSTAIIMGDYSNGNDAVLARDGLSLNDIANNPVRMCQGTVSEFLLSRALQKHTKLTDKNVKIFDVSDDKISAGFLGDKDQKLVVTWKPMVNEILAAEPSTKVLFDSSEIPGEIQDLCVINTKVLNTHPEFARALVGCWYEVLATLGQRGATADTIVAKMADAASCTPDSMREQLKTTALFNTAKAASDFTKSDELKGKNDFVRHFCFDHNMLGEGTASVDAVGIQYPDGTIQGDVNNVKMRYSTKFMDEFDAGKIKLSK